MAYIVLATLVALIALRNSYSFTTVSYRAFSEPWLLAVATTLCQILGFFSRVLSNESVILL